MVTYTWTINLRNKTDTTVSLHYTITGTDGTTTIAHPVSCEFIPDVTLQNIDYEQLTDAMLITWAKNQPNVIAIEKNILERLKLFEERI